MPKNEMKANKIFAIIIAKINLWTPNILRKFIQKFKFVYILKLSKNIFLKDTKFCMEFDKVCKMGIHCWFCFFIETQGTLSSWLVSGWSVELSNPSSMRSLQLLLWLRMRTPGERLSLLLILDCRYNIRVHRVKEDK